jgi:hypothetical protein
MKAKMSKKSGGEMGNKAGGRKSATKALSDKSAKGITPSGTGKTPKFVQSIKGSIAKKATIGKQLDTPTAAKSRVGKKLDVKNRKGETTFYKRIMDEKIKDASVKKKDDVVPTKIKKKATSKKQAPYKSKATWETNSDNTSTMVAYDGKPTGAKRKGKEETKSVTKSESKNVPVTFTEEQKIAMKNLKTRKSGGSTKKMQKGGKVNAMDRLAGYKKGGSKKC